MLYNIDRQKILEAIFIFEKKNGKKIYNETKFSMGTNLILIFI